MDKWTRAMYMPNRPLEEDRYVTACEEHVALSQKAAAEGMVLLKNEDHTLPLKKGCRIAAFGKATFDMVKGGGGSGDVYTKFVATLDEGLRAQGAELFEPLSEFYQDYVRDRYLEGDAPGMMEEPELSADLVREAAAFADIAVIAISRFSGEGWDRSSVYADSDKKKLDYGAKASETAGRLFPDGDYYLTAREKAVVREVCDRFDKVIVVLNCGGVMDTAWIRDTASVRGALLAWQGGMAGGLAAAQILFGEICPSGQLPDTFADQLGAYPSVPGFHESSEYVKYTEDIYVGYRYFETFPDAREHVVYPFGYGLSYTTFDVQATCSEESEDAIEFAVQVTNTGKVKGKKVVQIYYSAPQGLLGRPRRELGAFGKTHSLVPGSSEVLFLKVPKRQMAAFDDLGKISASSLVLEKGTYSFFLGGSVRDAVRMDYTWAPAENRIVEVLSSKLAPSGLEKRLMSDGTYEALPAGPAHDMNACAFEKMESGTEECICPAQRGREAFSMFHPYKNDARPLKDVADGKMTAEEFAEQLSDDDLLSLLGGTPNRGVANTFGIGDIPEYGIPAVMTADGPAGVRLEERCGIRTTAWPCETLLAATWNTELVSQVGSAAAGELKENNLHIWLAPAMNIHRSPLCGRNFEYYSEDPVLTGKMAAAEVRGIQENGVAACIKHFACNNKEVNRKHSDSRVSERALREIYLRGFEIAVKEGDPWVLMTSYNAINGQRSSESRDLLTDILRGEWGYRGAVITDWWNRGEHYKEILAGNDVKMAAGFPERVRKAMDLGLVTREDLKKCAVRVLEMICKLD